MILLFTSFFAGVLTVLAPCVLPLLPIIVGGAIGAGHRLRPYIIALSLTVSVVVFTLLLKASTLFIAIPESVWKSVSAVIIIVLGLTTLFPKGWTWAMDKIGLQRKSEQALHAAGEKTSLWRDVLVGAALGPVFSSCSPTYFLILATVLPTSVVKGTLYLLVYALGLALMLLLIGLLGRKVVAKVTMLADPNGIFRRGLGVLFIVVGVLIFFGIDKKISTYILDHGYLDVTKFETILFAENKNNESDGMQCTDETCTNTARVIGGKNYAVYQEITNPAGFVNSDPFTLKEHVGKKIILVDFMTYSCINCIRTFPYLKMWDEKYRDLGLTIVGIHTPEFAFEKKKENVAEAMKKHGLTFPIVLDNDYGTWNAYGNSYWPRKYIIDLDGHIVYDHIGEGNYNETEAKIRALLKKRAERLSIDINLPAAGNLGLGEERVRAQSPETYFGFERSLGPANGVVKPGQIVVYEEPSRVEKNNIYLVGPWKTEAEYIEAAGPGASVVFLYDATKIFGVMSPGAKPTIVVDVTKDGKNTPSVTVSDEDLFLLGEDASMNEHTIRLTPKTPGLRLFTFTFG